MGDDSWQQSHSAYAQIRRMILNGELAMGERIIETRLAGAIGLSRTPVREALRRLTSDGLVKFMPNRGYEVVRYSASDVAEIYSCRVLLESEAVRLVAERGLDPAKADKLERVLDEADVAFSGNLDPVELRQKFLPLNHQFHQQLYACCGNETLLGMIAKVTDIPVGIRSYFHFSDEQMEVSHAAHRSILRAVVARQPDRAAALMREHIWSAKDRMIETRDTGEDVIALGGARKAV